MLSYVSTADFCRLLDLDLVVRDKQGNILNPDITSTIQMYKQHEMATERIKKAVSQTFECLFNH